MAHLLNPRRLGFALVLAAATVGCGAGAVTPAGPAGPTTPATTRVLVNVDAEGVALGGHDPIAYATDGAPVLGVAELAMRHHGATFRFASAEHQATFAGDRVHHAPRYGGYCAYAASQNRLSPGDPQVWQIVDGQLVLFTSLEFRDLFNADAATNLRTADQHWPGLVAQHGTPLAP